MKEAADCHFVDQVQQISQRPHKAPSLADLTMEEAGGRGTGPPSAFLQQALRRVFSSAPVKSLGIQTLLICCIFKAINHH
jgi:hypothetical protein